MATTFINSRDPVTCHECPQNTPCPISLILNHFQNNSGGYSSQIILATMFLSQGHPLTSTEELAVHRAGRLMNLVHSECFFKAVFFSLLYALKLVLYSVITKIEMKCMHKLWLEALNSAPGSIEQLMRETAGIAEILINEIWQMATCITTYFKLRYLLQHLHDLNMCLFTKQICPKRSGSAIRWANKTPLAPL